MERGASAEISGKSAKKIGQFYVPSKGKIKASILGDVLQTVLTDGLDKQELFVRIQNIDSIEILEAPNYALLSIGSSIALYSLTVFSDNEMFGILLLIIGIAMIAWTILKKRRLMMIYSLRSVVPIYMNKPTDEYKQFSKRVMAIARQLNARPQPMTPNQTRSNKARPHRNRSAS